ncbi:hypothetical protein D3C78_1265240 [compost metagenome]
MHFAGNQVGELHLVVVGQFSAVGFAPGLHAALESGEALLQVLGWCRVALGDLTDLVVHCGFQAGQFTLDIANGFDIRDDLITGLRDIDGGSGLQAFFRGHGGTPVQWKIRSRGCAVMDLRHP